MTSAVKKFLAQYPKESTRRTYTQAFQRFFSLFYSDGELDEMCNRYLEEDRDHSQDVKLYFQTIMNYAKSTVRTYLSIIKTFFIENDIAVPDKTWRRLSQRSRNARATGIDVVPTTKMLRNLLSHMPIQGKAIFLAMSSSGMRIGETMKLTLDDIDLNNKPARIYLKAKYTKSNTSRIVFISSEATEAIEEWLKSRDNYIRTKRRHSLLDSDIEDKKRLFPFSADNARVIWRVACKKSNLEEKIPETGRLAIHPHTLRKYFRTKLGAVIPVDVVEQLMGHHGYLTNAYRRYSEDELAKWYLEGEPALMLSTDTASMIKVQHELETQQHVHEVLMKENIDNRAKIITLEDTINRLAEQVQDLVESNSISRILGDASEEERRALISLLTKNDA